MIELKLPRQQQVLYDVLRGGADVSIAALVRALGMDAALVDEKDERSRSKAQGALGPYIVRLNRRIAKHNLRVTPGLLKRTYRLSPLK